MRTKGVADETRINNNPRKMKHEKYDKLRIKHIIHKHWESNQYLLITTVKEYSLT